MSKKNFGRKRFGPYPGDFVNLYISRNVQILMIIKLSKRGPQIQLEPLLIKNRFNFVAGTRISMPLALWVRVLYIIEILRICTFREMYRFSKTSLAHSLTRAALQHLVHLHKPSLDTAGGV